MKRIASLLIATTALVHSGEAFAQAAQAPAADSGAVEEIIVTAQKSAQRLQDVALSIAAVSGDALIKQGIANSQDLSGKIVGINLFPIGNGVNVLIRGIGSTSVSAQNEATSAFEADGVYRSKPTGSNATFFDVDRVEVLKGPQGTLFGRNATVGALRVISKAPTFKPGMEASFETGNYQLARASLILNTPVSDTLAVRLAGQITKRDGYTSNGTNDADDKNVRGRVLWRPSDALSVLTTLDYYARDGAGPGAVALNSVAVNASTPANSGARDPLTGAQFFIAQGPYKTNFTSGESTVRDWGATTEITYETDRGILTLQPAYRHNASKARGQANSGVPLGTIQDITADQTSVEARIASGAASRARWVAGAYYFQESTDQLLNTLSLFPALPATPPTATTFPYTGTGRRGGVTFGVFKTWSYAAFGQVTYPLTDDLRVTGGLRYTSERKTLGGEGYTYSFDMSAPDYDGVSANDPARVAGTQFPLTSRTKFQKLNWKLGVEYNPFEGSMLYLNASTGFKAGGANAIDGASAPAATPRDFAPETLMEIAGGWKNTLLGGKLVVNFEAYRWDYDGRQQLYRAAINSAGLTRFINTNMGKQIIWGGAVEVAARPTRNDHLNLTVSYDHGKFTDDPKNYLLALGLADLRNTRVPFQAPWQASWSWAHDFMLSDGGQITLDYAGRYMDGRFVETRSTPISFQKAFVKHDLTVTYQVPDSGIQVRGWVRNITDKAVLASALTSNVVIPTDQPYLGYYEPPRTYGASLTIRY